MSYYVITIPGRATNYLALEKLLKKIFKRDAKISVDSHQYPEDWAVFIKGQPDRRLTMFALHHPFQITETNVESIAGRERVLDLEEIMHFMDLDELSEA